MFDKFTLDLMLFYQSMEQEGYNLKVNMVNIDNVKMMSKVYLSNAYLNPQ